MSSIFGIILNVLSTGATVFLAVTAFKGLNAWKSQMKGADQYKALLDIKKEFLRFKLTFQNSRLRAMDLNNLPIDELERYGVLVSKGASELWDCYHNILDKVNYYNILQSDESYFLEDKTSEVYKYLIDYEVASQFLFSDLIDNEEIPDNTRNKFEQIVLKDPKEDDNVSLEIKGLMTEVFQKINEKL